MVDITAKSSSHLIAGHPVGKKINFHSKVHRKKQKPEII